MRNLKQILAPFVYHEWPADSNVFQNTLRHGHVCHYLSGALAPIACHIDDQRRIRTHT